MLVQDDPLDDNYAKDYSYDDYSKGIPAPWIELGRGATGVQGGQS